MKIICALLFAAPFFAAAQTPEVPHKMSFAGMTLTIRDDARREIQKDVNALTQSPKHFLIKADRAKTYFPVIEQIFREEGVPDDFKYLVLQESSLISDAVSSSKAVGFWQFKDFTAVEMGLRVDDEIDERKNIAASTRAAANYIKKNNSFFDNWLYALQAYQMGAGGVLRSLNRSYSGEKHAEITSQTYWYVKKFLAHKIAFQDAVSGRGQIELTLLPSERARKTLRELSQDISVTEEELLSYNKWTSSGKIPADKPYLIAVPMTTGMKLPDSFAFPAVASAKNSDVNADATAKASVAKIMINKIPAVQALAEETPARFAERASVDLASFLKWNDLTYSSKLKAGAYYFLANKRSRAATDFHTVASGEDLWAISQRYGVKISKLKKYNRLKDEMAPVGTTLWLSAKRPKSVKEVVNTAPAIALQDETFNWTAAPGGQAVEAEPAEAVTVDSSAVMPSITTSQPVIDVVTPPSQDQPVVIEAVTAAQDSIAAPVFVQPYKDRHIVQPKETLYTIAKIYNVGVMELVKWNNLDLQQKLKIGDILSIKTSESQAVEAKVDVSEKVVTTEVFHEVQVSDTLYGIARKYGVTIKEIMEWNNKKDFSLSVGEKLKVKAAQ